MKIKPIAVEIEEVHTETIGGLKARVTRIFLYPDHARIALSGTFEIDDHELIDCKWDNTGSIRDNACERNLDTKRKEVRSLYELRSDFINHYGPYEE